ncbi:7-deoxyloganetin glucosyltransferase-like [Aristolochia californica]|uniref:7-deoxyloganetin glucosyltransferase-like n=1 Tax=Aristolochia californica TaxID=171875 RepID=UPI0035DFE9DE
MASFSTQIRPHAVLIPQPAQGHITPMLKLAKLLHSRGFYITFVNSEYNHQRFLKSWGSDCLKGLHDFRFEAIPDGLPSLDSEVTQDIPTLCLATRSNCGAPFRELITRLNNSEGVPKVNCIIADGVMSFLLQVGDELGIRGLVFWTTSACGFMGYLHFSDLIERGYVPLKDESYLKNGYLETQVDWVPGMGDIRLRDFPSFIRTTNRDDIMLNFDGGEAQNAKKASGVILNTFDELENEVIEALGNIFPRVYTIGPLSLLLDQIPNSATKPIKSSLWKEDDRCLKWLEKRDEASVVYVNFGSITVMTEQQLIEFGWGLANSKHHFLWVIRPDLIMGESAVLPQEFVEETKGRCLLTSWCPQEEVLSHPATGGFLTHCGWNSTLESVCSGVPMLCWPFFAEQPTNCRYACNKWGIGIEIDNNVRREEVELLVSELMEGDEGREKTKKAIQWKNSAKKAAGPGGSSHKNFYRLIEDIGGGLLDVDSKFPS